MAESAAEHVIPHRVHRLCGIQRPGGQRDPKAGCAHHPGSERGRIQGGSEHHNRRGRECEILAERAQRTENRGLKDILVLCADGLSGIKEAIATAYPMIGSQRCIVHVVRNTFRHVLVDHAFGGLLGEDFGHYSSVGSALGSPALSCHHNSLR